MNTRYLLWPLVLGFAALIPSICAAERPAPTRSITLDVSDLKLASPQDLRTAQARIRRAALGACESLKAGTPHVDFWDCVDAAESDALLQLERLRHSQKSLMASVRR